MNLNLNHLTKSFGDKTVIDDLSCSLSGIRSLAIIGPSGGGKSTLIRLIAGLIAPSSGTIQLDEQAILDDEAFLIEYRKELGMVFQAYNLFPHLTAIENVILPLVHVHHISEIKARATAEECLNRFQLTEHQNKLPAHLSGGQQQRVAIARAIASQSKYLLFDEPTSALDPELTGEVLDMINELREEGKEFIVVTHEMGFAKNACDYVLFIAEGKILEHGPSHTLFDNPQSKELQSFLARILEWN
ncbi:amino acid ABC transporter ATP-binding protein [Gottschalkiaceae bacterium SANA]|nr:amino acid ABC transporter ATP-binding protein [Gottschalkiaceae bacterium SANA]